MSLNQIHPLPILPLQFLAYLFKITFSSRSLLSQFSVAFMYRM